eukprot:g60431.t1
MLALRPSYYAVVPSSITNTLLGFQRPSFLLQQQTARFRNRPRQNTFHFKNKIHLSVKLKYEGDILTQDSKKELEWFCSHATSTKESIQQYYKDTTHAPKTAFHEKGKRRKQRREHGKRIRARTVALYDAEMWNKKHSIVSNFHIQLNLPVSP